MTKNTKAFTLIELLIVIVIIGILAVALIPRLTGAQASARDSARKANVQQIVTAIEMFKAENNGELPGQASVGGNFTNTGAISAALVSEYLQSFPKDPNGKEFTAFASGGSYIVCSEVEREATANADTCDNTALTAFKAGTSAGTKYLISGQ